MSRTYLIFSVSQFHTRREGICWNSIVVRHWREIAPPLNILLQLHYKHLWMGRHNFNYTAEYPPYASDSITIFGVEFDCLYLPIHLKTSNCRKVSKTCYSDMCYNSNIIYINCCRTSLCFGYDWHAPSGAEARRFVQTWSIPWLVVTYMAFDFARSLTTMVTGSCLFWRQLSSIFIASCIF